MEGEIKFKTTRIELYVKLAGIKEPKFVAIERDENGNLVQVLIGRKPILKTDIDILQLLRCRELIK